MDNLLSDLQRKYHELLAPVNQGLSQVGKTVGNVVKGVSNYNTQQQQNYKPLINLPQVASNYFDTSKSTAQNPGFWSQSNPIAKGLSNIQQFNANAPRVNLQQFVPQNMAPVPRTLLNFGAGAAENLLNTPQDLLKSGNQFGSDIRSGDIKKPTTLIGDVAQMASPLLNIATLGGGTAFKQVGKQGIKSVAELTTKQALLHGGLTGAGYGALFGGLQGLGEGRGGPIDQQLTKGVQQAMAGVMVGGALGAGTAGLGRLVGLIKKTPQVEQQLRDAEGKWVAGQTPVKPQGMTKPQWEFQLSFNNKYDRNPYATVNYEHIKQAGLYEVEKRGAGLSIRDVSKDVNPLGGNVSTPPVGEVKPNSRMDMNSPLQAQNEKLSTILPQTPKTELNTPTTSSLDGSGRSSGGSIAQIPNSENPYFNTNKLNVSNEAKQGVNQAIQDVKPQIEQVVGRKLSNQEVINTANGSAKVLNTVIDRVQTEDYTARLLRTRQQLAAAAESGTVNKEYIDNLMVVKSHATDIARKLQSFNIGADPSLVTSKDAILDAVLKVEKDTNKVIEAAKGVNFNDLKQSTDFYRQFVKPSIREWVDLIRYNSMLSSPNTHINNMFSNLTNTTVVAPIEKTLTGTIDFLNPVRRIQGKPQTQFASEGGAYLKGYAENIHNAAHAFADVMRGKTVTGNLDVRQIPLSTNRRVSALNIPTRLLEASDQFFTTLTKGGETKALELRKAKGVNVGNIDTQALDNAKYRLFRSELHDKRQGTVLNSIDDFTGLIQKARNSTNPVTSTIAKFTLPFVQTPMNIIKQGVEYSPAGFSTMIGAANKTEQLSKAILGSAGVAGVGMLIASGRTTWAEPTDPTKKAAFRSAGMQPYAVKVGNKWVSYAKLPPAVAFPIAFLSAIHDAQENKKITQNEGDVILNAAAKFGNFFADQSYVKNIGDLVSSAKGSPEAMGRFVSNYPQQLVPYRALLGWMARITDPYQRKVNTDANILTQQVQQLFTQIPGLSMTAPARMDKSGEPIPNQNGVLNAFSPFKITNERPDQKQYYDLLQQKTKMTRDVNALKDAAAKGQDISGMIGQVGAEETNKINPQDAMKAKAQMDVLKAKVKLTGETQVVGDKIIYKKNDSVSTIDLNPQPSGTGIKAFVDQNKKYEIARQVWDAPISQDQKDAAFKKLGVNAQDARYDSLAHNGTDISTQYIKSKSPDHQTLLNNLVTGRQVSISGQQFASNAVIDQLNKDGSLSNAEAKALKTLKLDKNMKQIGKASGTGRGRKPTLKKMKAILVKSPKSKRIKVKTPKLTKVKQYKLSKVTKVKRLKA